MFEISHKGLGASIQSPGAKGGHTIHAAIGHKALGLSNTLHLCWVVGLVIVGQTLGFSVATAQFRNPGLSPPANRYTLILSPSQEGTSSDSPQDCSGIASICCVQESHAIFTKLQKAHHRSAAHVLHLSWRQGRRRRTHICMFTYAPTFTCMHGPSYTHEHEKNTLTHAYIFINA